MKKFTRRRTLEEIKAECAQRGWSLDMQKHEEGSDFVSIKFKQGNISGTALINTFNGRLIGELDGGLAFNDSTPVNDDKPWFKSLLGVAYA